MVVVKCVCCVCIGMRSTSDTIFQKLFVFGDTRVLGCLGLRDRLLASRSTCFYLLALELSEDVPLHLALPWVLESELIPLSRPDNTLPTEPSPHPVSWIFITNQ